MLDEVEERRLGPVDVVEDDDERPPARERLEQPPDRPEALLLAGGPLGEADELADAVRDDVGLSLAVRRAREALPGPARRVSSPASPAAVLTASTSGQKVIPSP